MQDVSETAAELTVGGSIEGLPLKEFSLCFRQWGKHTGCQLAWVNGDQVGVSFIKAVDVKKNRRYVAGRAL